VCVVCCMGGREGWWVGARVFLLFFVPDAQTPRACGCGRVGADSGAPAPGLVTPPDPAYTPTKASKGSSRRFERGGMDSGAGVGAHDASSAAVAKLQPPAVLSSATTARRSALPSFGVGRGRAGRTLPHLPSLCARTPIVWTPASEEEVGRRARPAPRPNANAKNTPTAPASKHQKKRKKKRTLHHDGRGPGRGQRHAGDAGRQAGHIGDAARQGGRGRLERGHGHGVCFPFFLSSLRKKRVRAEGEAPDPQSCVLRARSRPSEPPLCTPLHTTPHLTHPHQTRGACSQVRSGIEGGGWAGVLAVACFFSESDRAPMLSVQRKSPTQTPRRGPLRTHDCTRIASPRPRVGVRRGVG
jgi:hypothetical protein